MPTYGQRPQDVVTDSRGNATRSLPLSLYLTESDAKAGGTPYRTTVTDERGRWTFVTNLSQLWVRVPDGTVWAVSEPAATTTTELYVGTTAPANLAAVWINTA